MYIPKIFKNENMDEVKNFIRENGFGILVSTSNNKLQATHIPFILSKNNKGEEILSAHISKGNKQLSGLSADDEVMVIFQGSNSYISSSWYDHENVPTWNYLAVHVYGKIRIVEGEELMESLKYLVDKYEKNMKQPVSIERMSEDLLKREIKGIIGFEITITSIEAASKLSQNRDDKNYKNIINELELQNNTNADKIAEHMKSIRKESSKE